MQLLCMVHLATLIRHEVAGWDTMDFDVWDAAQSPAYCNDKVTNRTVTNSFHYYLLYSKMGVRCHHRHGTWQQHRLGV